MTCAATLAMLGAVSVQMGGDTVAMAPDPEGGAVVCYHNHAPPQTTSGPWTLTTGRITVSGYVRGGSQAAERLEVTPAAGWWVWPPEDATQLVPDGVQVTVRIIGGVS